jgi:hypothetical protein
MKAVIKEVDAERIYYKVFNGRKSFRDFIYIRSDSGVGYKSPIRIKQEIVAKLNVYRRLSSLFGEKIEI